MSFLGRAGTQFPLSIVVTLIECSTINLSHNIWFQLHNSYLHFHAWLLQTHLSTLVSKSPTNFFHHSTPVLDEPETPSSQPNDVVSHQ